VPTNLLEKAVRSAYSLGEKPIRARTNTGLTMPDFLGIGAQKAGTTWLFDNLRCHPQVSFSTRKELHYFDRNFHQSLLSYAEHFRDRPGCKRGEITPAYSALPRRRIRFIRQVMPEVRLMLLLRNPIDRAWSHAVMNLATKTNRAIADIPAAEFYAHFTSASSVKRGCYPAILDNWFSVFPREQLFVGMFDDITARPQDLLSDVFDHLGVATPADWTPFPYQQVIHARVNGTRRPGAGTTGMPAPYRAFLRDFYAADIAELQRRFGTSVAGWS
jgi:hypothetical protein